MLVPPSCALRHHELLRGGTLKLIPKPNPTPDPNPKPLTQSLRHHELLRGNTSVALRAREVLRWEAAWCKAGLRSGGSGVSGRGICCDGPAVCGRK